MAPEIVEGGESGHDKVLCSFMFLHLSVQSNEAAQTLFLGLMNVSSPQWYFSWSLLRQNHKSMLLYIPGGGLVEPWRVDVRAFDRWITLHRWWRRELTHRHRQVWILPVHRPVFSQAPATTLKCAYFKHCRRILKKDPPFPKDMGSLARDVIQRLLIKDPKKRLGSGPNGADSVKKHPFYQVGLIVCLEMFGKSICVNFVQIERNHLFFKTHFRKLTGKTWQLSRCPPRSSLWFGMSWMSATLQMSSQRWTPPTPPQRFLRTVTVSSRWEGDVRQLDCSLSWLMLLLFLDRSIAPCSLQAIAQDNIYICLYFLLMFFWVVVAGSAKCWHGWKIALCIIHFCLWLYLTYSTAIKVIKWSFECPQKVAVSQHESVCMHWYSNWLKGLLLK